VAWAGERRSPYREYGQAFRRTHDAKDPGPSGCVAAGARGVAVLDRIAYTLFGRRLADRLAATQRSWFNLALTCSSHRFQLAFNQRANPAAEKSLGF